MNSPYKSLPSHECNDLTKSNFKILKFLHLADLTQNIPNYFPDYFKMREQNLFNYLWK